MKFAITADGPETGSQVDPRFGRARFFRVIDSENSQHQVVDNQAAINAVQGAGIQAAQTLANLGVQAVVTGHVGPKAWAALRAAEIQIYSVNGGRVEEAAKAFMAGQLSPLTEANVQGHW